MKLKTQLVTGALATILALGSTMCVYANPSVTAVPSADHEEQYETGSVEKMADYDELTEVKPVVMDAIAEVNKSKDKSTIEFADAIVKDGDEKTAASAQKIADTLKKCEFLTDFFDVYVKDHKYESNAALRDAKEYDLDRTANGNFRVTLKVPSLTRKNQNVRVMHYRKAVGEDESDFTTGEWEILVPISVDYDKKEVVVEFKDFSPAAILAAVTVDDGGTTSVEPAKEETEKKTPAADNSKDTKGQSDQNNTGSNSGSDNSGADSSSKSSSGSSSKSSSGSSSKSSSGSSSDSTSSSSSGAKSPKTGVADPSMYWLTAAGILAGLSVRFRH